MFSLLLIAQAIAPHCGNPGDGSRVNTQAILVNAGPASTYFNGAFTSVTVCVPGTSTCQTIGGVLVDTGSSGLRVLASALTIPLPQQTGGSGVPVAECGQFADGFTWGPVQMADITLAGEQASNTPIQVIGAPAFSSVPSGCSNTGSPENTLADLGANGILGVQTTDPGGNFTTVFNGQAYSSSFIDSGSNGLFLLDSGATGLPLCSDAPDFYCPPTLSEFSATNRGVNGISIPVPFHIGDVDALNETFTAFSEIGGPNPGQVDWGLPFFYGRTVFLAIEGQSAPGATGPYWAY